MLGWDPLSCTPEPGEAGPGIPEAPGMCLLETVGGERGQRGLTINRHECRWEPAGTPPVGSTEAPSPRAQGPHFPNICLAVIGVLSQLYANPSSMP